ncbi:unnamed protein product [Amoebophrya sp. A120]|nr:unnamed protein product [Amoebophrya sp. A120]|eukprot:GSA120T00009884001.1
MLAGVTSAFSRFIQSGTSRQRSSLHVCKRVTTSRATPAATHVDRSFHGLILGGAHRGPPSRMLLPQSSELSTPHSSHSEGGCSAAVNLFYRSFSSSLSRWHSIHTGQDIRLSSRQTRSNTVFFTNPLPSASLTSSSSSQHSLSLQCFILSDSYPVDVELHPFLSCTSQRRFFSIKKTSSKKSTTTTDYGLKKKHNHSPATRQKQASRSRSTPSSSKGKRKKSSSSPTSKRSYSSASTTAPSSRRKSSQETSASLPGGVADSPSTRASSGGKNKKTTSSSQKGDQQREKRARSTSLGGKKSSKMPEAYSEKVLAKPYKSGQNSWASGLCIGTYLDGTPCMDKRHAKYLAYCKKCCDKGDPSLSAIPHPKFGKQLVCNRDLPKDYVMALWGDVQAENEMSEQDDEWGFETHDNWNINPVKHPGSVLQFSQCPGPHEKISINFANPYVHMEPFKKKNVPKSQRKEKYASMMFKTVAPVPKGGQLNMMYAEGSEKETQGFFEERGLTRCDVWTPANPTFLKKGVRIKDLMTEPPVAKSKREEVQVVKQSKMKPAAGWGAINLDDPKYRKYEIGESRVMSSKSEKMSVHKTEKKSMAMGVMKKGAKAK